MKTFSALLVSAALIACTDSTMSGMGGPEASATSAGMATADADMQRVLDALMALGAKPIATLTPEAARTQPTPADAVRKVLTDMGKTAVPADGVTTREIEYRAAAGTQAARIYTPANARAGLPVIVYFHGGGWVIGGLDAYDAGARALAREANAVVMSATYRKGPENKFPAAHDDAVAAWRWAHANAASIGGDPARMAVAGESAGGNLAINVAIAARDEKLPMPRHMTLVYPVAGNDMQTASYVENANAKPLDKAAMEWFVRHALPSPASAADPRIDLVGAAELSRLPSATVITAEIDPLRSEGQMLADKLERAGSRVTLRNYDGAAHEFFGMDAAVGDARAAQTLAGDELEAAFARDRVAAR